VAVAVLTPRRAVRNLAGSIVVLPLTSCAVSLVGRDTLELLDAVAEFAGASAVGVTISLLTGPLLLQRIVSARGRAYRGGLLPC
jgi:hypothetical protein